jgi:hypothetical protein
MATSRISNYGVDLLKYSVNNSGTIAFDASGGEVTITSNEVTINGNLSVMGESTTIESSELIISDNTITVNAGESGAGITLDEAGIIFDRGSLSDGEFFFQETKGFLNSQTGTHTIGAFVLQNQANALVGLYTNYIGTTGNNDLILLGDGPTVGGTNNAVVTVTGTNDYERNIYSYTGNDITFNGSNSDRLATPGDDDALPNVRLLIDYVRSYHLYNFQAKISSPAPVGNTEVEVFDTAAGDPVSKAAITIDGNTVVEVFGTQTNIEEIGISDNSIFPISVNDDLILSGAGTGSVQIPTRLLFTKSSEPTAPADGVKLYSKVEADGGTGLYFVNENSTRDEIISRNKALLYSIIF